MSLPSPCLKTYNFVCMKSFPLRYVRWTAEGLGLCLVLLCRFSPDMGELYARHLYPVLSAFLSALVSWIPFSMEEWFFVGACVLLVGIPLWNWKKKKGWKWTLRAEAELLVGVYLWFYVGWGINYFRKDFFTRSSLEYVAYQDSTFQHFLADYTRRLNQAYTQSPFPSHEVIEKEAKQLFAQVPSRFGLSSPKAYQHPKRVMFNTLYSGVGVLGYMGLSLPSHSSTVSCLPCNGRSPMPMSIPICWE